MKRFNGIRKSLTRSFVAGMICLSLLFSNTLESRYVYATDAATDTQTTTENTEAVNADANGILGKNSDVGIEVTKSVTGKAGKKVKISFKLKSTDASKIRLKNVYPVIDDAFLFETSGDAYKIVKAGSNADKQKALSANFKLTARSDVESGYHGVRFIGEYEKTEDDGTVNDYYVIKTINIYFEEEEDTSDSDEEDDDYDDEEDEEEEAVAPKLIITGYETEPAKIMAGDTFKMTIHIQNTSKTTSVCNGKFLIGNEAGSFLPTSGSSAVFVESIPAGKTGDIVIEMKADAKLEQKNYILVVKGDFDDGKGNNFSSSDNLTVPVYQEVKLGVSEVSLSPSAIGIGEEGTLMFTVNNKSSVDVYDVSATVSGDAVAADEGYVGNIAGSSSAYATLYVTGQKDNSDTGMITVVLSYEDAEGNIGTSQQTVECLVSENADELLLEDEEYYEDEYYDDEYYEDEYYEDEYDEEGYILGLPYWVFIIIGVVVLVLIIVLIVFLTKRKKKRMAQLLEDDGEDDLEDENI